jgi:hypothetical protein
MKYKVTASYITNCVAEVTADNADEAYRIAKDMDGGDFKQTELGDWKIQEITLSENNFTEEQLAFIKAYSTNVAVADDDVVKAFVLIDDHDEFYKDHSDTYSGLADARGVWEDAKRFFTKEK